jgi:protein ImuB
MKRHSRTAALFDALQAPVPPRLPPPPHIEPSARVDARQLWAAVRLQPVPDAAGLQRQAGRALHYSSRVSLAAPDIVLLEVRGSLRLFGGLGSLLSQLRGHFHQVGVVSMAPTALAAVALARSGQRAALTDAQRLVSRLAPLPLACLSWSAQSLARLAAVGVVTVGEALRLPRAGFAQRFGHTLLDDLDRLVGRRPDPRVPFVPVERFAVRFEPSYEMTGNTALLRELQPHLLALQQFLLQRQRGITALLLSLEHRQHVATRIVLRLAVPEHCAQRLSSLLAERLRQVVLPAPVRRCGLRCGPLLEAASDSAGLWQAGEQGGGASTQMPAFLENLRVRLGAESVHGLSVSPDHRPEHISRVAEPLMQVLAVRRAAAVSPPWAPGRRPLWLLPVPQLLEQDASGWPLCALQRLQLLAGPERLETGWWDGADIQRDYYVAADANGARLWVYRQRDGQRRWFLHGPFG